MSHLTVWFWANVWPNLVASAVWAVPGFGYTLYRIEKHHKKAEIHREHVDLRLEQLKKGK